MKRAWMAIVVMIMLVVVGCGAKEEAAPAPAPAEPVVEETPALVATATLTAREGETEIRVDKPERFQTGIGRYRRDNDDVGLCELDDSGCTAACGNGVREEYEQCDNGPGNSDSIPGACRTDWPLMATSLSPVRMPLSSAGDGLATRTLHALSI